MEKFKRNGGDYNMIALGQILAEGREKAKMSALDVEAELKRRGITASDSTLGRIEKGTTISVDPELIGALIEIYKLKEPKVYGSLRETAGIGGALKFIQKAVQLGKYRQAILLLETMEQAA